MTALHRPTPARDTRQEQQAAAVLRATGRIAADAYRVTLTHDGYIPYSLLYNVRGDSVAERLACWTQAQKGLGSNRSRDTVG